MLTNASGFLILLLHSMIVKSPCNLQDLHGIPRDFPDFAKICFLGTIQDLHRWDLRKIRIIMMTCMCSQFSLPGWRLRMVACTSHYIQPRINTYGVRPEYVCAIDPTLLHKLISQEHFYVKKQCNGTTSLTERKTYLRNNFHHVMTNNSLVLTCGSKSQIAMLCSNCCS